MTNALANPLQGLLAQASRNLPARTGAVEVFAERLHRVGPQILLADVSGSMSEPAWSGRRKIDVLREAVAGVTGHRLMTFATEAGEAGNAGIPEPAGGTALHLGLAAAARHQPRATLVVSDGQPDDEDAALRAAERLTGVIHVLYIGPESNVAAIGFMRRLARAGAGTYQGADLQRPQPALQHTMQALLAPPR